MIKLRYLNISDDAFFASLLLSDVARDINRDTALKTLDVPRDPGENPLSAWLRWTAAMNGIVHTEPCAPAIADAIRDNQAAGRFAFFLA